MRRPVKKHSTDTLNLLLSCIESHKNTEAISIMTNQNIKVGRTVGDSKRTLLHYAAEYDNSTFAQYLIDKGCQVDAKDKHSKTPLIRAVYHGKENVTRTLLAAGAKINDFQAYKDHFMMNLTKSQSSKHLRIIKLLFDKFVDRHGINDAAQKLHEIHCPFPAVIFLNDVELTKRMLDLGCSIDELLPGTNESALELAVHLLDFDNIKILVNRGANVNARDSSGHTPLFRCNIVSKETDEILKIISFLLNRGASLTKAFGYNYFTDMSTLLRKIDSRTLRVLLPYINFFRKNDCNRTLFYYLVINKRPGIVSVLQERTFELSINERDVHGLTLVDIAAFNKNVEMVQFLLENGAHANNMDIFRQTYLSRVMGLSSKKEDKTKRIIKFFLQYGANAQYLLNGKTPILPKWSPFVWAKPILAHFAMIESSGEPLHERVWQEIEYNDEFKNYFDSCKVQVEKMKDTMVYESISLHMLLFQRKQMIAKYALNREFTSSYKLFIKNNKSQLYSYYASTLELRVGKIIDLVQMKREAAEIICEIIGLPSSMNGTVGQNVADYLQRRDLNNILQI